MVKVKRRKKVSKMTRKMKTKLMVMFGIISVALAGLVGRLMYIEYTSGEKYEKKVLSLQSYDSKTIAYQRGDIVDRTGTVLATSVAVYNVILDCSVMTDKEEYIGATIDALVTCFPDLKKEDLQKYATEKKTSKYIVLAKQLTYEQIQPFINLQDKVDEKGKKVNPNIKGVWFETEYIRKYPFNTLAASVIGFTSAGNVGTTGLENYYDDILNGINGRQYGYLNSDNLFEKTVIPATDGYTLVTSIDANIQSIVEEKIKLWNDAYKDNFRIGDGAENIAVVIMNPNTGEILACADYPQCDLNNPRDLTAFYSQEQIAAMTDEDMYNALNEIWQNFAVSYTYEPGSVQKPLTIAGGIETGTVPLDKTYVCDGYEVVGKHTIKCSNNNGHGVETVEKALMDSCNDALMQMSYDIGPSNFLKYQNIFNFGLKTGIDLPGEPQTATLIHTLDKITDVDLATNVFGQNFNCTMMQMASAFSSLINGGNYYQPHVVTKITDASGNTVSSIEPTLLKQTVSTKTSDLLKQYLYSTVSSGTGGVAKVDGYSMGGKTGTAEKQPREDKNYLVSFIGFAPYENPELVIYTVIDTPNSESQPHSNYAQMLTREILREVLPYMNIYPDEEKTGKNEGLDITNNGYYLKEDAPATPEAPEEGSTPATP